MKPSHGFGRLSEWRLESLERSEDGTLAQFRLDSSTATSTEFPNDYEAQYVIRAGERLSLELTVANAGSTSFTFEEVLHTYLAVGDVSAVFVEGLEGAEFVDKVTGPASPPPIQSGPVTFGGEVDRVYRSTAAVRVVDPLLHRVLVIEKSGSRSTVVWNPGAAKASEPGAADIGPDHWAEFVCVEGGNVQQDAVTLAPGESSTMTYGVHVETIRGSG
jgi:glucose-6-phosphate 1-epimerase